MSKLERVDLEPAFVLHARRYRETSLIVEAFGRAHGRVGLVARGARRPKSRMRGLLQPFLPLLLSWRGRGELATLTGAEPEGGVLPLTGSAAIVGFYLNELLLSFIHRHDPEPGLFDHYRTTLGRVACEEDPEPSLRIFEKRLLEAAGYALELEREVGSGAPIEPDGRYRYIADAGPERRTDDALPGVCVSGSTLLALAREQIAGHRALGEAKRLMRSIIDEHRGGRTLVSRTLWKRRSGLPRAFGPAGVKAPRSP